MYLATIPFFKNWGLSYGRKVSRFFEKMEIPKNHYVYHEEDKSQ